MNQHDTTKELWRQSMNRSRNSIIGLLVISLVLPAAAFAGKRERANRRCSLPEILAELPTQSLSTVEAQDILFSREEEKLARDVYISLYEKWELKIFRKIKRAEKIHMKAILRLINRYEDLDDPIGDNAVGVFTGAGFEDLYKDFVNLGSTSEVAALEAGARIEEMDIRDLQDQLARTDNTDIQIVYQNLLKGSRNHLRAFVSQLDARDTFFEPQYLSTIEYAEIIESGKEKGGTVDENGDRVCGKRGPQG
jgi:hypothetical protein